MRLIGLAVILTVSLSLAPLAAATQPEPYTTERISFSSDGFRIVALLGKPAGPGPFPVYISNHGSMPVAVAAQGPWTSIVKNSPADVLATDGYVVLVVARRGYRGSEGTTTTYSTSRDYSGKRAVDVIRGAEAEAHDVVAAVDYLASLPYVDKDRIGIGGVSLGGLVSVIAAARDPRIRAVVSMAGGYRQTEAARGGADEAWGLVQEIWKRSAPKINGPTLLLWAKNDTTIDVDVGRDLEKRLKAAQKPVEMKIYPSFGTNGHSLFSARDGFSVYVADVVRFLDASLKK